MDVDVLGTKYTLTVTSGETEPRLTDCDGFCDETTKEIFVENYQKDKDDISSKKVLDVQRRKVARHEIIHAFLCESGLAENSHWAQTEEMVDWFAIQLPKMCLAMREVGALDEVPDKPKLVGWNTNGMD